MKQLTLILLAGILFSCNNASTDKKDGTKDTAASTSTATTATHYPYTIDHPDYWEIGSTENTQAALSALKAWEEGKLDESIKYFADSVQVQFDGLDKKMSNDSLKAFLTAGRNSYKTIKIKMDDWESVISKDKKQEWVTLWYKQNWETPKGVKDSFAVVNDMKLKNGKIVELVEYTRKFH